MAADGLFSLSGRISIGDWRFLPAEALLVRGGERRRLEHRAAEVLALLCRRRGSIVTQGELVDEVWAGRSVSPNSVAVVIADLRRALDDDARVPRYIETISKRGYRLALPDGEETEADASAARPASRSRLVLALMVPLLVFLSALWLVFGRSGAGEATPVTIGRFVNETGNPRLDPMVASVRELTATSLGKLEAVRLERRSGSDRLSVTGRLIMWEGHPALALSAENPGSGRVVWTGMASGPGSAFPRQVPEQIGKFGLKLEGIGEASRTPMPAR